MSHLYCNQGKGAHIAVHLSTMILVEACVACDSAVGSGNVWMLLQDHGTAYTPACTASASALVFCDNQPWYEQWLVKLSRALITENHHCLCYVL